MTKIKVIRRLESQLNHVRDSIIYQNYPKNQMYNLAIYFRCGEETDQEAIQKMVQAVQRENHFDVPEFQIKEQFLKDSLL